MRLFGRDVPLDDINRPLFRCPGLVTGAFLFIPPTIRKAVRRTIAAPLGATAAPGCALETVVCNREPRAVESPGSRLSVLAS
jgi:hypothetical protein